MITQEKRDDTKSILFDDNEVVYHGSEMPFNDETLLSEISERQEQNGIVYINGALTESLYDFLSPFKSLVVVLDNFTQYLNITTRVSPNKIFIPHLFLLHPVEIKTIFVKQETDIDRNLLPKNMEIINLFRSLSYETGI